MTHTHNDFDIFLTHFKFGKPNRQEDMIFYKVRDGMADRVAKDANQIIEEKGLNLTAIPTPFFRKDSVVVQFGDREV